MLEHLLGVGQQLPAQQRVVRPGTGQGTSAGQRRGGHATVHADLEHGLRAESDG